MGRVVAETAHLNGSLVRSCQILEGVFQAVEAWRVKPVHTPVSTIRAVFCKAKHTGERSINGDSGSPGSPLVLVSASVAGVCCVC